MIGESSVQGSYDNLLGDSVYAVLWRHVLERAARIEAVLGPEHVLTNEWGEPEVARLRRALTELAIVAGAPGAARVLADEVRATMRLLPGDERRQLGARLLRGINPRNALDTWPVESLFDESERQLIAELKAARAEQPVRLNVMANAPRLSEADSLCVIVKVTRQCNLRCEYCHDWRSDENPRMSFEVLATLMSKALSGAASKVVEVVWHGGEPTLLGRREFARIIALQRQLVGPGVSVFNRLQTNGTNIDERWAAFLADFAFQVKVSVDGTQEIHDRTRPMVGGQGSYRRAMKGLKHLRSQGLASGLLMVVGEQLLELGAEAFVDHLHESGVTDVGLLPVRPGIVGSGLDGPCISSEAYAGFLADVHRARLARPEPWIVIRELDQVIASLRGEAPSHCEFVGKCAGAFYSIECNGDISHCDKYLGDANYTLGNVMHDDFVSLRSSPRLAQVAREAEGTAEACGDCKHFSRCRGWCPHERYVLKRQKLGVAAKCCGLGPLFDALEGLDLGPLSITPPSALKAGS